MTADDATALIERYISLGLALGRHVDGFVDAYYGPPHLAERAARTPPEAPAALRAGANELRADLAADRSLGDRRRGWVDAQVRGLATSAAVLAGETLSYLDEVEASYGVRPHLTPEDELEAAHRRLDAALPGSGPIGERLITWREAQRVPPDRLHHAIASIADDLRERTHRLFGLPDGEHVDFELVDHKPWSGFNYYLGDLRSRVAINTDLPVLATGLGHLVAHEAYPGHHTEHSRKEVGLVRSRHQLEETIFLVGTPQCLLAEGLADLGLEIVVGRRPEAWLAGHLHPLEVPYDADLAGEVAEAGEVLGSVRGNAAILLHEHGRDADEVTRYVERWSLTTPERAAKAVEFLTDPTWRAYVFCYIEGVARCRAFAGGDPARFARLLDEQLIPADLTAAA